MGCNVANHNWVIFEAEYLPQWLYISIEDYTHYSAYFVTCAQK